MHKLIVVGSGVKSLAHITDETKKVIQNASKVLYLVNEENLKAWIQREAKLAESLESIYFASAKRVDAYSNITNYILTEYYKTSLLCVVFYGHPTIFADSALNAVKKIIENNGDAIILPAISSMDCLFSDLKVDPGNSGCFTIDATELLIYERPIDVFAHVILWQISNLGMHDSGQTTKINVLCDYLLKYYSSDQMICIYESALLPTQKSRIQWIKLEDLIQTKISVISTLYIPPKNKKELSNQYISLLNMDIQNYKLSR